MKDYSKYLKSAQDYILSYKVENGTIVVNFADKSVVTFVYDVALEQRIIEKMRNQAIEVVKNAPFIAQDFGFDYRTLVMSTIYGCTLCDLLFFSNLSGITFVDLFIHLVSAAGLTRNTLDSCCNYKEHLDIQKLNYFLNNEQKINENLAKGNVSMENVRKKAVKAVMKAMGQNQAPVNLNNIDIFSLNDLAKIREQIERIEALSADSEEKTEEQGKTLTKDYNTIQK